MNELREDVPTIELTLTRTKIEPDSERRSLKANWTCEVNPNCDIFFYDPDAFFPWYRRWWWFVSDFFKYGLRWNRPRNPKM